MRLALAWVSVIHRIEVRYWRERCGASREFPNSTEARFSLEKDPSSTRVFDVSLRSANNR